MTVYICYNYDYILGIYKNENDAKTHCELYNEKWKYAEACYRPYEILEKFVDIDCE